MNDIEYNEIKRIDDKLYIKLYKNPYDDKRNLYKNPVFELKPGITVLVGCNGYGKSTFLKCLENALRSNKIKFIKFNNLIQGGSTSISESMFVNDIESAARKMLSSEGENIFDNIKERAYTMGSYVRGYDNKDLFILFDAIDGLSIDVIIDIKKYLFTPALKDAEKLNKNLYIFVSANNYEFVNNERCLDVHNNKYLKFNDYTEYRDFILKSNKDKSKRFK